MKNREMYTKVILFYVIMALGYFFSSLYAIHFIKVWEVYDNSLKESIFLALHDTIWTPLSCDFYHATIVALCGIAFLYAGVLFCFIILYMKRNKGGLLLWQKK